MQQPEVMPALAGLDSGGLLHASRNSVSCVAAT
jgi:hypothetical protein